MALTYAQHAAAVAARATGALALAQAVDAAFELHQRVNETLFEPEPDQKVLDIFTQPTGEERLHQGGSHLMRHFMILRADILVPTAEGDGLLYNIADALTPGFIVNGDGLGLGVASGAPAAPGMTEPRHQGRHWMAQTYYPYDFLRLVA